MVETTDAARMTTFCLACIEDNLVTDAAAFAKYVAQSQRRHFVRAHA
jgi:hypothetical protein